jgi:integrase/recombinase XerD
MKAQYRRRVQVTGPLAPYADGFRAELARQGYAPSSAAVQLKVMAYLSRRMASAGVSPAGLTPEQVGRFVAAGRAAGYRYGLLTRHGLPPLLGYLRGLGVSPAPMPRPVDTPIDQLMERYQDYLVGERSLAAGTVRYYERFARLFLSAVAPDGAVDPAGITTAGVSRFLLTECAGRSFGSAKNLVAALRSLLRFLHVSGLTATPLVGAVPAVAPWRQRSQRPGLTAQEAARLLGSCDRRGAVGRRDYAVLVVLARLGLRAAEVAAMTLDDIDWRRGEITVHGKGNRDEQLPLPADVGEAVAGYLRRGRPRCADRHVFLRVHAPVGGLSGAGVSNVVRSACRRAGLPVVGAHRLRHTLARRTLRAGGSLDEIGQLLRQGSAFTTARYATVDLAALQTVTRPWPGSAA